MATVEELDIDQPTIINWSPRVLRRLEQIRILRLNYVEPRYFSEVLANLTKLKNLTKLSVHFCYGQTKLIACQQSILRIALELGCLQSFSLISLGDSVIWERKTAIDFVRIAENLQEIHFENCDFGVSSDIIRDLTNARRSINKLQKPLDVIVAFIRNDVVRQVFYFR